MDTALGRDVTRVPANTIPVLPLADAGWTPGSASANTLVDTIAAYLNISTPGAVTVSVQIYALTVPVDCRLLVHLSSGHIVTKIVDHLAAADENESAILNDPNCMGPNFCFMFQVTMFYDLIYKVSYS